MGRLASRPTRRLTIGLLLLLRATSSNPSARNVDAAPVYTQASATSPPYSVGYASTIFAPRERASRTAPSMSARVRPFPRCGRATKKQVIDQTGRSSTGASVRERARRGYASRGSMATHPTGSAPAYARRPATFPAFT
jgi:hypothetical protein